VEPPNDADGWYRVEEDPVAFVEDRNRLRDSLVWFDERGGGELVDLLVQRSALLSKTAFYPLVASLFLQSGFPVWRGAPGDTSSRFDLLLVDEEDSLPVEVKSRPESAIINVKSIQQALENKIILDNRAFHASRRESSTLVVGYEYPPARSDATELIDDIDRAYGIRVGLVSIRRLYELAVERSVTGRSQPRALLAGLKGPL